MWKWHCFLWYVNLTLAWLSLKVATKKAMANVDSSCMSALLHPFLSVMYWSVEMVFPVFMGAFLDGWACWNLLVLREFESFESEYTFCLLDLNRPPWLVWWELQRRESVMKLVCQNHTKNVTMSNQVSEVNYQIRGSAYCSVLSTSCRSQKWQWTRPKNHLCRTADKNVLPLDFNTLPYEASKEWVCLACSHSRISGYLLQNGSQVPYKCFTKCTPEVHMSLVTLVHQQTVITYIAYCNSIEIQYY